MTAEVTQLITIEAAEHVAESPFYIPMTGPATRPRCSLKHDDTFIVLDSHGDIGASAGGPDGLFNADTPVSRPAGDGARRSPAAAARHQSARRQFGADRRSDQFRRLPQRQAGAAEGHAAHRAHRSFCGAARPTSASPCKITATGRRASISRCCSTMISPICSRCAASAGRAGEWAPAACSVPPMSCWNIAGLDGQVRITALHFEPRPTRLAATAATYHFELAPKGATALFVAVSCNKPIMQKPAPFFRGLLAHRREMRRSTSRRGQHRDVERYLQRGAVPGNGRPQHADDGNAAGAVPLCGHSLVFDHVRPRRI